MRKPKFKVGDRVRILDGSEVDEYTGGFPSDMARLVGKIATVRGFEPWPGGRVAYLLGDARGVGGFSWDERGLELVGDAREQVVIYRCGRSVFAKDLMTHRIVEAKCSPEDKFDFYKGAALALDRLFDREGPKPEPEPEEPKYYNGMVVCVKAGFGPYVDVDVTWWTVGKIYDVINGVIRDNEGDPRPPVLSVEELNRVTADYAEFVALVGPEKDAPNYYNGKVVCVKKGRGLSGECNVTWWTVGRIYDVVDGVIRDDKGDDRISVGSLTELNRITRNYAEFIALVE